MLLIKKLGGLVLIIFGCLLTGVGFTKEYNGVAAIGVLLLAAGVALLALKIVRRNQRSELR